MVGIAGGCVVGVAGGIGVADASGGAVLVGEGAGVDRDVSAQELRTRVSSRASVGQDTCGLTLLPSVIEVPTV